MRTNINEWNTENEEKLNEWKQYCIKYSLEHSNNSNHFKRKIKRIMYFTILLSGIASILSGIASYFNDNNVHLIISVSIINGIITSLNLYKNLENFEKSMKLHIESAKGYNEISMKITEQLLIEPNERIKYHIFEKNIILQMLSYDNENILLTIDNKYNNPEYKQKQNIIVNHDMSASKHMDIGTNNDKHYQINQKINIPQLTKQESARFGLFLNRFQHDTPYKKYYDIEMNLDTNHNSELNNNSTIINIHNKTSSDSNETSIDINEKTSDSNEKTSDSNETSSDSNEKSSDSNETSSDSNNRAKTINLFDYNEFTKQRYQLNK